MLHTFAVPSAGILLHPMVKILVGRFEIIFLSEFIFEGASGALVAAR